MFTPLSIHSRMNFSMKTLSLSKYQIHPLVVLKESRIRLIVCTLYIMYMISFTCTNIYYLYSRQISKLTIKFSSFVGSGTAICVSPHADHMYIVGTEEGKIYKCSKAYKDHYLDIYDVCVCVCVSVTLCVCDIQNLLYYFEQKLESKKKRFVSSLVWLFMYHITFININHVYMYMYNAVIIYTCTCVHVYIIIYYICYSCLHFIVGPSHGYTCITLESFSS